MDPNIPIQPARPEIPVVQPVNKTPLRFYKSKFILIILALIILIIVGAGGYYMGTKKGTIQQSTLIKPTSVPTITPILSPTNTPSNTELETYVNPNGFSIVYGKRNSIGFTSCSQVENQESGTVTLRAFEDLDSNTVYIGNETEILLKTKIGPAGGRVADFSNCSVVENTLELIKNGFFDGDLTVRPNVLDFHYKKINSDEDLVALSKEAFGNGCVSIKKTPINTQPDTYSIKISDKNGNSEANSECWTNFLYDFFYSAKNKIAVAGSGIQNCPFSAIINVPNGLGLKCEAQILFAN